MIGIYKITNPIGQVYIGKSVNIKLRLSAHSRTSNRCKLNYSIKKYGWSNHICEVVEECDESILYDRERYWQEYYNVISPKKGLNSSFTHCSHSKTYTSDEHRYWINTDLISYEYVEYELIHKNINYLVEGVIEITKKSKTFFTNDVKINGTSIKAWTKKYKIFEINDLITKKINNL